MSALQYFRYTAYALIAVGLINLRYQGGKSDLTTTTVLIVGVGFIIFALTYLKAGQKFLATTAGKSLTAVVAAIAAVIAIIN
ncbi:MAG: hypothetical protein RLY76_1068 [Actinomycetota bacterium]